MNLGSSTSKLNTQDNNKQYITSRIFSSQQDNRNEEKNNLNISPQPTQGGIQISTSNQTPGTPYYPRSVGPYYSINDPSTSHHHHHHHGSQIISSNSGSGLSSTPPRRFGINSSSSNLMHHNAPHSSSSASASHHHHYHHHHHQPPSDLAQIPISSIYDDPKQQKLQILNQHQQHHNYQELQKKISIQQQQSHQDQLYQYITNQQQQQQQQQQLQQSQLQQSLQPSQQQYNQSSSLLSPQDLNSNNIIQNSTIYGNNTLESFDHTLDYQQQQQLQLSNLGLASSNPNPKNIFIQSVPTPINQMFSEKYDKRWLTVFGFPQDKTDLVIDEISKYGKIQDFEYPYQANCNWIYLKFESEATATDILKKNGLIIANFMIGIVPYKDKIMNESNPIKPQDSLINRDNNKNIIQSEYSPKDINSSYLAPSKPSIFTKINEYVFGSG